MRPLSHALLKTALALFVAAGLSPLAHAHECTPGVIGVDLRHRIWHCTETFCYSVIHVCPDRLADVIGPIAWDGPAPVLA